MIESDSNQSAAHGTRMRWLLLTRPAGRSDSLAPILDELNIECVHHPLMRTFNSAANDVLRTQLALSATLPRRVYVSPAAVDAIADLDPRQLQLPAAAVGETTAAALAAAGCKSVWSTPEHPGIDGLFALDRWQALTGATLALFCAAGGRVPAPARMLQLQLDLCAIHVYRREILAPSATLLQRLRHDWRDLVLSATSIDLLRALDACLVGAGLSAARGQPLLVLSERIAAAAKQLGYTDIRPIDRLQAESLRAALAVSQSRG